LEMIWSSVGVEAVEEDGDGGGCVS
jgi:hypothetical protein